MQNIARLINYFQEMLQTIFQFVDARAISHCVKVSKYWNFVISERKLQDEIYDRE